MKPLRFSASALLFALACSRRPPTLAAPPPADPPTAITLDVERILRGTPAPGRAGDTESQRDRIRGSLLRHRAELQECYERLLPANPEAGGRMTFEFTVETTGAVIDATAETEATALRPSRECMLAIVRRERMEGITHAARVRFPVEFANPPLEFRVPEFILWPRMRVEPGSIAAQMGAGSGNLTPEEARAVIGTRLGDLLGCYTALLRTERRAENSLRFDIVLGPDGSLTDAVAEETPEPFGPAVQCMLPILRDLHFRGSGRVVTLQALFTCRPREQPSPPPPPPPGPRTQGRARPTPAPAAPN